MKLSTRMRYGTRALVELALLKQNELLSINKLAGKQGLSVKYLEQIMAALKKSGLIESTAGVNGGYRLAKVPRDIRMDEVFRVLEGPTSLVRCVAEPHCCRQIDNCPTIILWRRMSGALEKALRDTTLHELVVSEQDSPKPAKPR